MYYQKLRKLCDHIFHRASSSDIGVIDEYLAGIKFKPGVKVSPWRVAKKTGVDQVSVYEIMDEISKFGVVRPIFLLWCPETRITISSSYTREALDFDSPCSKCDVVHSFSEADIYLTYELVMPADEQPKFGLESPVKKKSKRLI